MRQAELAHTALGCRGVTRSDFRYDDLKDDLVLLEVNNQPGMTPTSLVPEQAAFMWGWTTRPWYSGWWKTRHACGDPRRRQGAPRSVGGSRPERRSATYAPAKLGGAAAVGVDPARGGLGGGRHRGRWRCLARHGLPGGRAKAMGGEVARASSTARRRAPDGISPGAPDSVQGGSRFLQQRRDRRPGQALTSGSSRSSASTSDALQRPDRTGGMGPLRPRSSVCLPDTLVIAGQGASAARGLAALTGATEVIDQDRARHSRGRRRACFADLPLIVGEGANENAASILPLAHGAAPADGQARRGGTYRRPPLAPASEGRLRHRITGHGVRTGLCCSSTSWMRDRACWTLGFQADRPARSGHDRGATQGSDACLLRIGKRRGGLSEGWTRSQNAGVLMNMEYGDVAVRRPAGRA